MIELPEAVNLAKQMNEKLAGKTVQSVVTGNSPHKFAFFNGDPAGYGDLLAGRTVEKATSYGSLIEVRLDDLRLLFGDGVVLRYLEEGEKRPVKHQLLLMFTDGTGLCGSVQMYGGLWCFREGTFDSKYYDVAREKPSPLSEEFDERYFDGIVNNPDVQRLSTKALLATEQRIPGLGNGVLQDILYNAGIHPKRKIETCTKDETDLLFGSVKSTLREMALGGGRDTEKDLFGNPGGYRTKLSKNTAGTTCSQCGGTIIKQPYMGGSIYVCESCQVE